MGDKVVSEVLPAGHGHRGCQRTLLRGPTRCTCNVGNFQSCIRGAYRPSSLHKAKWTFSGTFQKISKFAANMLPIPEPQLYAESAAHNLKGIQDLLQNRIYYAVIIKNSTHIQTENIHHYFLLNTTDPA